MSRASCRSSSNDLTLPLTRRVNELFGHTIEHGQGGLHHSALILKLERLGA